MSSLSVEVTDYTIISLQEQEKWHEYLNHSNAYDIYHSCQYHSLEKGGDPCLFVYQQGSDFIAFPLVKRQIDNTKYFDLTSAYGYVGPICNRDFSAGDDVFLEGMKRSFLKFLDDEKIVSIFSRLHPLITQRIIIEKFGGLFANGKTVAIDLETPIDEQRKNYRRDHSRAICILHEKDYYIKDASNAEGVSKFVPIYHENMRRVKASASYFFDEAYFNNLMSATEFSVHLLLVYQKGRAVAGGVFTFSRDIIEVHLLSTLNKFLYHSPVKLLIDEISQIGRKLNMRYLHLGGGVGGKEDSLFSWKAGFSDLHLDFDTWRYICKPDVYDELVQSKVGNNITNPDFFPLYRS